jgi:hypothetical protein
MTDIIELLIERARLLTDGLLFEQEKGEPCPLKIDDAGELGSSTAHNHECPFLIVREASGVITDPEETITIECTGGLYSKDGGKAGREAIKELKNILARLPLTDFGEYSFQGRVEWEFGNGGKQTAHHFQVRLRMIFTCESEIFSYEE